jgi:hypothetical protein
MLPEDWEFAVHAVNAHENQKALIIELADALEKRLPFARVGVEEIDAEFDLVQRAREATK